MFINLLLFTTYIIFISFAVIGFGRLTIKCLNINEDTFNLGETLLIGFFTLFGISLLLHFFLPLTYYVNLSLLVFGLIIFIFKFKEISKLVYFKSRFYYLIFILLLPSIIVIRTHADYEWYHLPYINYLNNFKIIFGLANFSNNLAFGHGWQDILSLFSLPVIGTRGLTAIGMVFYFGYLLTLIKYIEEENNINTKILIKIILIFSLATFNKLIDFGAESQPLMLMILFGLNAIFFTYNKNSNFVLKILFFFIFSIFLRIGSVVFLPTLLVLLLLNYKIFINTIITYLRPLIFSLFILFLLLSRNFIHSGCLIFPIPNTCVFNESIEWSVPIDIVKERYYVQSSKSKGLEFYFKNAADLEHLNFYYKKIKSKELVHPKYYTSDIKLWSKYWIIDHDTDRILNIIIIITICNILFLFAKLSIRKNKVNSSEIILLISFVLSSFFWFYISPQTRYGGIAIIALSYSYLLFLFIFVLNYNVKKLEIVFKILVILPLIYINIKNINRFDKLNLDDFQKFPFPNYTENKVNIHYNFTTINNIKINLKNHDSQFVYGEPIRCGNIEMICIPNPLRVCIKDITMKKEYIFVSNTNNPCLEQYKKNYWQH